MQNNTVDDSKEPYSNNLEHILDELKRIDLIVSNQIKKWRRNSKNTAFPGLFISEEEVDSLLEKENIMHYSLSEEELEEKALMQKIETKKTASKQQGLELRLDLAAEMFGLSSFEVNAVLLVLASELDLKYEKLFAYLQDDVTKKHATIGLIFSFFCKSKETEVAARQRFSPNSPLVKNMILHLQEGDIPLLEKTLKLDDRIIDFLLGSNKLDYIVSSFASIEQSNQGFENLTIPETLKQQLITLTSARIASKPIFLMQGNSELIEVAEAISYKANKSLLYADLEKLKSESMAVAVKFLFREARLQQAAVYVDKFDFLGEEPKRVVLEELKEFDGLAFVPSKTELHLEREIIKIIIPRPTYVQRLSIWCKLAGDIKEIEGVPSRFKFGRNKIIASVKAAKSIALFRDPSSLTLTIEDLYAGCRAQLNPISLAKKATSTYKWEDIVLPPDKKEQLNEVCCYVRNYSTVYESWGFDKHNRGTGLNVLFSGPSGTGKTMAAEIISGKLGLDMYKIDLSMVVSKYIGETEKNLNRIFKDAEESNVILFFDEADALFGKRSEIRDSHDRYANIEINYLLQKMEEHEGIVILASNMNQNIDDAFIRRMKFIVEFPFPNKQHRLEIWKKIFPKEHLKEDEINFEFLSTLQISGGSIQNIALTAAFLAAEESSSINMKQIIKATRREFQKIGKVFEKEELSKFDVADK